MQRIDADLMRDFFDYISWHPAIKYLIFEIDSWGGSMFDSKTIIGYMDEFKAKGGIIETVVKGKSASAAFIIFVNGTKGYRKISPTAHLMWHELWQFKFWSVDTPSSLEDEAKTLRFFMDVQNKWLSERCNLTKKELDALVHKKELWCDGLQAVNKYGFADKLIE
jgi:ATP-dependent protease ClpP protease subunit